MKYTRKKAEVVFTENNDDDFDFFSTEETNKEITPKTSVIVEEKDHPLPPWVIEAAKKKQKNNIENENFENDKDFLKIISTPISHLPLTELLGNLNWVRKLSTKEKKIFEVLFKLLTKSSFQIEDLDNNSLKTSLDMDEIVSIQSVLDLHLNRLVEEQENQELIITAIERLYKGCYGICKCCQKTISEGRLKAKPYAIYCVNCREKLEKIQAQKYV